MADATTERADFLFAVKEHADGTPFIMLEPRSGGLKALANSFISLELAEGVSMEQAKALAQHLNDRVEQVSHTKFAG